MRKFVSSLVLLAGIAVAGPVWAHAHLVSAEPKVGETVVAADSLKLVFSEGIEIKFSKVEVTRPDGGPVALGAVALDPADDKVIIVSLPGRLPAGTYRVHWTVVSVDTHRTQGTYDFTVAP